jgi:hypothetical protein
VSHSGGGRTPSLVAAHHPAVRVVSSEVRRLPGAARNAGVLATRGEFVAFLAADCRAAPGWASGRLRHHRAGAVAVASAVVPAKPCPPAAASSLLLHRSRRPEIVPHPHHRLGVSYSRAALERHGPFPDLELAEDAVFNARLLTAGLEIVWAPDVVAEHVYPTSVRALLADQWRRGRMAGAVGPRPLTRGGVVATALGDGQASLAVLASASTASGHRLRTAPLIVAGALAKAAGAVSGGSTASGAVAEVELRRRRALARRAAPHEAPGGLAARPRAPIGEGEVI